MDLLDEQLGEGVRLVCGGFADVSLRRRIDDVTDSESLDGLILTDASSAVSASHVLDVTATVLRSTVVSAFDGHSNRN